MGEIFVRPVAPQPLTFTGERLTSALTGETSIEHWHRYLLAREIARNRDVLDVACGEGYGSALMAQTARSVVGVDVSDEAVTHAAAAYGGERLTYLSGDARRIPLADASVDLVVSFETLEHFVEHDLFLAEVKRVLRPGGALLVSTPERDTYSPADQPPNPFHARELTTGEFTALLSTHFAHVTRQMQRVLLGSALVGIDGPASDMLCFERRGGGHFETSPGLPRGRYVVALASDEPAWRLPSSLYIDTSRIGYADGETLERIMQDADGSSGERAACERRLAEAKAHTAALQAEVIRLSEELRGRDVLKEEQEARILALRRRADALEASCARAEEACRVAREEAMRSIAWPAKPRKSLGRRLAHGFRDFSRRVRGKA